MAATIPSSFSFVPHTAINDGSYKNIILLFYASYRHQRWLLQKYYPSLLCLIPTSTMAATTSFSFVPHTAINNGGYKNIILLFYASYRHQRWRLQDHHSLLLLVPTSTMAATITSSFSFVPHTAINDGGYNNIILLFC